MKKALRDLSPEEQSQMPYEDLCAARRRAYADAVAHMSFPPEIHAWARSMEETNGPIVQVWANHVSWLEAFMIIRYGEEPSSWPTEISADDITRAQHWDKRPAAGVTLFSKERSALLAQMRALDEKE